MKVFFNHLAKCGGTTIDKIARDNYNENFHRISAETKTNELISLLKKEHVFIAAELASFTKENIDTILSTPGLVKIILGRDPVERFISFCGHSTRNDKDSNEKVSFWGHEKLISQPISAEDWLNASLDKFERGLSKNTVLSPEPMLGFAFPTYSQWWLASFKKVYDPETGFEHVDNYYFSHIHKNRNIAQKHKMNLGDHINNFIRSFYSVTGSTSNLDLFVNDLYEKQIFTKNRDLSEHSLPRINSSEEIRMERLREFSISGKTAARYYSLLPEEFFLHRVCFLGNK